MLAGIRHQGSDRPRQEELGARHGVRRVGARYLEPASQAGRQRLAQVMLDELGSNAGTRDLLGRPAEYVTIGVDNGEPPDSRGGTRNRREPRDRNRS